MQEVQVTVPSGRVRVFPYGTKVWDILKTEPPDVLTEDPIAALVNNQLTSLFYKVDINCTVEPVLLDSNEGVRIYRNSLCFLLNAAAHSLFPERRLIIGHSLGNGYFYYFQDIQDVDENDLRAIEARMREVVAENTPIFRRFISYSEAIVHFRKSNQPDTMLLLEQRNDPGVPVFAIEGYMDLAHGPLVPSTGVLQFFEIRKYNLGFLLRFPSRRNVRQLAPFKASPLLYSIYQEYKAWGKILGVHSIGRLNEIIYNRQIRDFIEVAETLHEKKIGSIADRIQERRGEIRVVLIAGPSSSGKTTFTKKLAIQLRVVGFNPVIIGLDEYFLPHEFYPKDEDGNLDFEALEAIDIQLLNEHLLTLFDSGTIELPDFDFKTGTRNVKSGRSLQLGERSILIMEGIHGLNDKLTPRIAAEMKFKIYVSALTQLNLDDHNRISTTDNRLLRRMVRDYQFRGYSALDTIRRWPSVRRGENRNIFPYQDNADVAFNSALDYELAVLKVYAEPLLKTVKPFHPEYREAMRLLTFLGNIAPLPATHVPNQSILREFIGQSGFKY